VTKSRGSVLASENVTWRWSLGLLVALVVVGAAAAAGSVGGKPEADALASAPGVGPAPEMTTGASMTINWGGSDPPSSGIEVFSWSWGLSNTGASAGGSGGAGRADFEEIVITKELDKSSPSLMLACASGQHIPEVKIDFLKMDRKGNETVYLVITMSDVLVSSFQTGGSSGSDTLPVEQVSFNYAKIEVTYTEQKEDGTSEDFPFGWDIAENKKV